MILLTIIDILRVLFNHAIIIITKIVLRMPSNHAASLTPTTRPLDNLILFTLVMGIVNSILRS